MTTLIRVGDHPLTAINVAGECGIIRPSESLLTARLKIKSKSKQELESKAAQSLPLNRTLGWTGGRSRRKHNASTTLLVAFSPHPDSDSTSVDASEANENSVHPADHSEEPQQATGTPSYKILFDTEDGSEFDDSFLEKIVFTRTPLLVQQIANTGLIALLLLKILLVL